MIHKAFLKDGKVVAYGSGEEVSCDVEFDEQRNFLSEKELMKFIKANQ